MKKITLLASAAMFSGILLLGGCEETKPAQASAPASTPASAPATIQTAKAAPFIASGPLVVENQVDVAAERAGVLSRIMAEPGTRVSKGQVLATLDDRQVLADREAAAAKTRSIEADLKNWEAEAKVLDADYQRAQKMWEAQLITKEQLDHARYKAESDHWDVERVRELLINARNTERSLDLEYEKTRIRAPFQGLVARRYVSPGQRVAAGDRMFWVTAVAPLRVKFTLPERFLGQIKVGQKLILSSPDVQEPAHGARVIQVSPVVDPSSGTIEVLAELQGPAGQLRPGMSVAIPIENPQ
jgi:RND family efflux transporter MFP subunit